MVDHEELFYRIALTQTNLIGAKTGRQLLTHFGNAHAIFKASPKQLQSIDGLGPKTIAHIKEQIDMRKIEDEISFIERHQIAPLFITEKKYPKLLKSCSDAPLMLYFKGNTNFNDKKLVAIIGTRKNTEYGNGITEALVAQLAQVPDIAIVSGLALGIDVIAHRNCVQLGVPTIGVLAHGLDTIYPSQHRTVAKAMVNNGGLLTEYVTGTKPDKFNFPMRNRIVAGMCYATIVVETETKGGAMITAKLATSYNREVAAIPGRCNDKKSEGCNYLIKTNIAQLINNGNDFLEMMNWEAKSSGEQAVQTSLFGQLTSDESTVVQFLENRNALHVDELLLKTAFNNTKLSSLLLTLELNGIIKALPGKKYQLK